MNLEGKLIAFEGTDGVGKSTQVQILEDRLDLARYDVLRFSTPSNLYRKDPYVAEYNQTGASLLRPTTLAMMAASDRLRAYDTQIRPHLDAGGIVVCDRYKFSAEAYFEMRGADMHILRKVHEHLPDPDLAVLLTLDATARLARLHSRATTQDWEEQDMEYQDEVQRALIAKWKSNYAVIDASQSVETVAGEINEYVGN